MQLQTSRVPPYPNPNTKVHVLSPHLCIGAFLLVWPPLLTPTNELRIMHDMDRGIDFRACRRPPSTRSTRWWRQAAPCSSSNDAIRKTTRTAVADHVLFAAFALYNCTAHCSAASI